MAEKDNIQVAKDAIAAINNHDIDRYLSYIDPSYTGDSETMPGPVQGREGVRDMMRTMFQAFPDFHLEIDQILAAGDHLVNRVTASGTHRGAFAGVPPTNKKVTWQACNIVEVRNGKMVRSKLYADNLTLFRQLGAIRIPEATTASR